MELLHITNENFDSEVLKSDIPVLADFYADWCGPCKMLAPIVEELAGEYAGRLKVVKINVDQADQVAATYSVMSIPTVILFKNGEAAAKTVGFVSKENLIKNLEL